MPAPGMMFQKTINVAVHTTAPTSIEEEREFERGVAALLSDLRNRIEETLEDRRLGCPMSFFSKIADITVREY